MSASGRKTCGVPTIKPNHSGMKPDTSCAEAHGITFLAFCAVLGAMHLPAISAETMPDFA